MRKTPQQARSRKTRQKLIEALGALLKEKDFDQVTVIDIAKRAGVSSGLLYSHFKNKADFLEALLEEYKSRVTARLEEVEAEDVTEEFRAMGSLRSALRLIARFAYNQVVEDVHLIQAISYSLKSRPQADKQEWQDLRRRASQTITPILDVYETELARPNNALTAEMLVYFFNTIYAQALLLHESDRTSIDIVGEEAFISEVADFAFGYLTTKPI